tara:strand:+ start:422 stop:583 length:162 start_codon:yes stop_codon:yes gene_type:complete
LDLWVWKVANGIYGRIAYLGAESGAKEFLQNTENAVAHRWAEVYGLKIANTGD